MCLTKISSVSLFSFLFIVLLCAIPRNLDAQVTSFDLEYFELKERSEFQKLNYTSHLLAGSEYQNVSSKIEKLKRKKGRGAPEYQTGDQREFFVRNIITGNTWNTTEAILGWQREGLNIWIEKTAYDTLTGSQSFADLQDSFNTLLYEGTGPNSVDPSKGVLELLNQFTGDFPNVDGDGVLDVLLLNIRDNFGETGSFVAGFFDPVNLFEFEYSNEMDLLYLDLYPTVFYNGEVHVERAVSTFAHEAQHLIHAGYEGEESELVFINEGFSEAVEILSGFEPRSSTGYQQFPLRGLFSWNFENPLPDYSRASLWTQYLVEQLGAESLKKFVSNSEVGLQGYDTVLREEYGLSFKELFRNWGIALWANNTEKDPAYGYQHPEIRHRILSPVLSISDLPEAVKTNLAPWTHIPINFPLTKELSIQAGSIPENAWITSFINYPGVSSEIIQTDNSNSATVSANDLRHGSIQSVISFFGDEDSENKSPFSFFAEGVRSGRVVNSGYGDGSPDAFYLNASYLALNGYDQKIGVVFPAEESGYWLKEVLLRTVFRSELESSGIDGDEKRDFELDIFTFKNGKPGASIIPTTFFESQREAGKLVQETFSLDPFYDSLSELKDSIVVVIGNDSDDQNFVSIGMDEGTENASYFSENPSGTWVSLADKSIGGNSLSGWNPIIRINTVVSETVKRSGNIIVDIYNSFDQVFVELQPVQAFDSNSVRVVAQLPDGSFQKGKFISKDLDLYTFSFPILANGEYRFHALYKSQDGTTDFTDEQQWEIEIPDGFELGNNYPNPFNPETSLLFILLEEANISWQIFDVIGRKVIEIPKQNFASGEHSVRIRMDGLASGMYLVRAKLTRNRNGLTTFRTQKMMLIK